MFRPEEWQSPADSSQSYCVCLLHHCPTMLWLLWLATATSLTFTGSESCLDARRFLRPAIVAISLYRGNKNYSTKDDEPSIKQLIEIQKALDDAPCPQNNRQLK